MRLIRILKRESPWVVAREAMWRAQREWNRRRLPKQLVRPGPIGWRNVSYYRPTPPALGAESRSFIVGFADEVRTGHYPFLSYGTVELGTRPKWNLDFVSGAEWRLEANHGHASTGSGADIKAPWELSRLQFLPVLGKAHVLTGDDSYREAAKGLLACWIESNPVPKGVNWTVAMEAGLRAMSICFLLNLLSPFRSSENFWLATVVRSLARHLLYIDANLEFSHLLTSNHYLSDIVGLYCLAVFLEGKGMEARRQEYRRRIEAEMRKQVYEDGGDYEASTGYHVLVTQLFTSALLLMRADGSARPSGEFIERLRRMYRWLHNLASASGELPQVGDCDDGRTELLVADDLRQMLTRPREERNSLRVPGLLGVGRWLFGEGEGPVDDAAWYGPPASGLRSGTSRGAVPAFPSHSLVRRAAGYHRTLAVEEPRAGAPLAPATVFPQSGIGILRQGAAELLFFAIPNGIHGKGSHTHNDKLSFVLRVGGQEILCDSGTGCYTRYPEARNRFRSTAAHNTVQIDGAEQNRIFPGRVGLFILGDEAAVSLIEDGQDAEGRYLRASHRGYSALGVTHTRTVRVRDDERMFVIEDELAGQGIHDFELHFHLAPDRNAEIAIADSLVTCRVLGEPQVQLAVSGSEQLEGAVEPALTSSTYGATTPALKVRVWGRAAVPIRLSTRISWAEVEGTSSSRLAFTDETSCAAPSSRGSDQK
jgi:hypothetical protein